MRIWKKILDHYNSWKLGHKLLCAFALASIIPLLLMQVFAFQVNRKQMTEKIDELKAANKVFESAIVSKDVVNIVDADVQFHDIIYAMTDNQRLIQIINNLREQMYRYRLEYVKDARTHSILINEHNDIIREVSAKNVTDARVVVKQHINNQEKGIVRLLNK